MHGRAETESLSCTETNTDTHNGYANTDTHNGYENREEKRKVALGVGIWDVPSTKMGTFQRRKTTTSCNIKN